VFKLAYGVTESVLFAFHAPSANGADPGPELVLDNTRGYYGTASFGGITGKCCGNVFALSSHGDFTPLHNFAYSRDGWEPNQLVADSSGNLYGTTLFGGLHKRGSIFQLTAGGTFNVLHDFTGGKDGQQPSGLVIENAGNLYGTTYVGGGTGCNEAGCGVIFEVPVGGTEKVVYAFQGGSGGSEPVGGVTIDADGNLYGATQYGGNASCLGTTACGIVYELSH